MSGLYPVDQDINIFGEIIKFPSMGSDGKFTNGDFTDPKKPASFIPAETMNLIIDNLNNLIKYCGLEPNNTSETQLKEAIDKLILNKSCPIESTYIQFAEDDGTFNASKSPEQLFGGTWQLKYNNESVFFRTEGSLSEESRSNGIQPYGMKNLYGSISSGYDYNAPFGAFWAADGIAQIINSKVASFQPYWDGVAQQNYSHIILNTNKQIREYSDDIVVRNRKIRIYERIS